MTPDEALAWADQFHAGHAPKGLQELAAAVRKLRDERRWIPCSERLPDLETPVWLLCWYKGRDDKQRPNPFIGCRTDSGDGWIWADCMGSANLSVDEPWKWICDDAEMDDYEPTHWQPLPEGP